MRERGRDSLSDSIALAKSPCLDVIFLKGRKNCQDFPFHGTFRLISDFCFLIKDWCKPFVRNL